MTTLLGISVDVSLQVNRSNFHSWRCCSLGGAESGRNTVQVQASSEMDKPLLLCIRLDRFLFLLGNSVSYMVSAYCLLV